MRFAPRLPPENSDDLQDWVLDELRQVEQAFNEQDLVFLVETNVAPPKPRNGMILYADGTNWNPGSGRGIYARYGGAWVKL